jgi:acyl-CoA thioesterase II
MHLALAAVDGEEEQASGSEGAVKLGEGRRDPLAGDVDERVERGDAREHAGLQPEGEHVGGEERNRRMAAAGDRHHLRGEVDAAHVDASRREERPDVPGTTAHVGNRARAGRSRREARQELAVERFVIELVGELLRVVVCGDVVAGGDVAGCGEVAHPVIVADHAHATQPIPPFRTGEGRYAAAVAGWSDEQLEQARELAEVIALSPGAHDRFRGSTPDWFGEGRIFGGVVVAQALSAAVQTAPDGVSPHSMHGYFLRAVRPGPPVDVAVDHVRDGRSFSIRQVAMAQEDREVFRGTCSFHAEEEGEEYQLAMTEVPDPDGIAPDPYHHEGPFDVRDVGPTAAAPDGTFRSTRRMWVRCAPALPDDARAHVCVAAYLSDMTGTAFRPLNLGEWGTHTDASLDHAVWFHRPLRADEWLFYDLHALVNTAGRSLVRGAMYQDGRLCLSMAQELLIRRL